MKHLARKNKGFTMIETLVAITILMLGITAPIVVAFSAINTALIAKDKISAFYFAQEGIEYIRHIRDTNIIRTEADWLEHTDNCTHVDGCYIDDILETIPIGSSNMGRRCNVGSISGNCRPIEYGNTEEVYGFFPGPDEITKFTRRIELTEIVNNLEAEIVVTIRWSVKDKAYTYVLRERIFNWSGS